MGPHRLPVLELQAQRKADALLQALSALGDKVKQQMVPNKDLQKEIADLTEVNTVPQLQGLRAAPSPGLNPLLFSAVAGHRRDLSVAEGRDEGHPEGSEEDHGRPGPQLQGRHSEEGSRKDEGGDREQSQPAATRHGDGDRSLSKGRSQRLL